MDSTTETVRSALAQQKNEPCLEADAAGDDTAVVVVVVVLFVLVEGHVQ